jgi:hypothetical protein
MLGRTYENYRMVSNMCQAHAPNTDKSDFLEGRIKGKDQKNDEIYMSDSISGM